MAGVGKNAGRAAGVVVAVLAGFPLSQVAASAAPAVSAAVHPASGGTPSPAAASSAPAGSSAPAAPAAPSTPATPRLPLGATAGALFMPGDTAHSCTGSVISSTTGDLVLTAAHCISGTGAGVTFAPGYRDGDAPYGTWTVEAAYAAPGWISAQNPDDDLVVLRVKPRVIDGVSRTLQSVVGAERIGTTAAAGATVSGYGYVAGRGGSATSCTTTVRATAIDASSAPILDCEGFAGGTSGGPWLAQTAEGPTLVGIVGGAHQGGCSVDESHTPVIGSTLRGLVRTAEAGTAGSALPEAGSDGC